MKKEMKSSLMLAVNPNSKRQKEDFYATNPKALLLLLESLKEDGIIINKNIWECACGEGHLSKVLINKGYNVKSSDIFNRGFGDVFDFLKGKNVYEGDILTNPPFILAEDFFKKGIETLKKGNKLLLFLKVQFLESETRYKLFKKYPPKYVYLYSSRQQCSMDGDFKKYKALTQFYTWFIWEKGYIGETLLRWIKPKLKQESIFPPKPEVMGIQNAKLI